MAVAPTNFNISENSPMKLILTCFLSILSIFINAQDIKISGYIKDSTNNEALIGAVIYNTETQKSTDSNNFGYFCISLPANTSTLSFSYVGYQPKQLPFKIIRDTLLNIYMTTKNDLKEVVVHGKTNDKVNTTQTSMEVISAKTVSALPVILGESDLMRTLVLLPGVTFGTENSPGYFVRGGSNDQNLLLIDGVPVYNAYHLYGFFSVFNTDAINKAMLYKGDMPARYGERLSSLLDIQLKEGNSRKYSGEFTTGYVTSKFLLEGPILKGKTSFLITGRRSMMDLIPAGFSNFISRLNGLDRTKRDITELSSYYFYDLTAKINHTFSDRSRLFFSYYRGKDDFLTKTTYYRPMNLINWGNSTASLRWNYLFSNKLFSNFTLYSSNYNYFTQNDDFSTAQIPGKQPFGYSRKYSSGIRDYSGKMDFEYGISGHSIKFGAQYTYQNIKPGVSTLYHSYDNPQYNIDTTYNFNKKVQNGVLYVEDSFKPLEKLSVNAGLRVTGFYTDGKLYPSIQPRFSCNYQLVPDMAIKASFSRVTQNLHLLSNNILGGPGDIWVPSTRRVAPAVSNQLVMGIAYNVKNLFTVNVEAYTKNMNNLIMYKEGASYLIEKNDWQDKIETGTGKSRGIEFSLNKESGKTTGWISYTLSKSDRKFENINFGRGFPYTYDRRHSISIALVQKIGKKFSLGADWVYVTGHALTLANTFVYNELLQAAYLKYYNSVNNYRMPAYHRLDLCINYRIESKKINYTFSLGAYNAYNRANPYILMDTPEGIRQQSLFPILPYISFSVKF
jgi:hypothetical protein